MHIYASQGDVRTCHLESELNSGKNLHCEIATKMHNSDDDAGSSPDRRKIKARRKKTKPLNCKAKRKPKCVVKSPTFKQTYLCTPLKTSKSISISDENTDEEAAGVIDKQALGSRKTTSRDVKSPKLPKRVLKQAQLTDYFPVRRSERRLFHVSGVSDKLLLDAILEEREDGLEVKEFPGKGRGVVSTLPFRKGDFVVEYAGEHISLKEARKRESAYSTDPSIGCYVYYFNFKGKKHCIDATAETGRLGRLLNHSMKVPNCKTRALEVDATARLILVAMRDIPVHEELLYDYGDRSKSSVEAHPWLLL